ncbi:MAG TPA: TolC family protein [Vicinamibacterales bacterium]|jgi:outer membrane protein TolC|nr:TolC family protein [Vicinamibacterales bacterium]
MLRVTVHDTEKTWRLQLEGKLAGEAVIEVERAWLDAPAAKPLEIDMRAVSCADPAGQRLLYRMHRAGAALVAQGVAMKALVDEIRDGRLEAGIVARFVALLVLALLLPTRPASAQAGAAPLRLTLQQAVTLGLKQAPEIAIANLNLAESQQGRTAARGALLPQVSFAVSEKVTRASLEALFGRKVAGFPDHSGPFWSFEAGPTASVPVFDLTLWNQWRASREGVNAAAAQQTTARELNAQLVVSQYLGTLRASAEVEAAASRLDLAKALFDLASDMQRNGVGTSLDTLRANVEYQNERQRHTEASAQLAISLQGLRRLLSLDPDQPIELADRASFFETPVLSVEGSLERAYQQRPELKAVASQIKTASLLKQSAQSERLPRLSLAGGWSYQGLRPATSIPAYQYGAYLQVPLFTGGRIGAEVATRDIEVRKLTEAQRQVRDQVGYEVRTASTRVDAARTEVEAANLGVTLAREGVTQAQDRFRAGVANNIEVITAQNELSRANDNQISALYRYNQARADVARATGQMESLYAN